MLNIEKLGIEFSGRWLFRNASYQFLPGEKIGLIGRNGTGKSTLLKIIVGKLEATEGHVHRSKELKIAHFHQDLLSFETDQHIFDVAREAFAPIIKLKTEIDTLLKKIESGSTELEIWDELANKQAIFEGKGGDRIDASVAEMLSGLGFSEQQQHQAYKTFSGGWRMRVLLAKMLLEEPDILLLDEPTNHLDLPSIQWLENYLQSFTGTCVIVSHDRFFLDRMVNKVLEISRLELSVYAGNYEYYLNEKEIRHEQQKREYENQQKYIEEQQRFIDRFRAKASKAKQVQSKIKMLEKVERIEPPEEESVNFNLQFKMKIRSGKEVLSLKNVRKAYGENVILEDTSLSIMRGDKIALIGANGIGKSTLLRVIADREPFQGERIEGHQVVNAFFAQHQLEALNLNRNILEEVSYDVADKTDGEIRNILGCFMFSGDSVEKQIRVLSGGEKSRVALAKSLLSEANFLLLDEPTNHLDIQSIQVLVEALNAYEGTFVVVSHDRFFLSKIANKIWYIDNRQIREYPGTYQEYMYWREKQQQPVTAKASQTPSSEPPKNELRQNTPTASQELSFKERKQLSNRIKKLERTQEKMEERIMEFEEKKEGLQLKMAEPEIASDFLKIAEVQAKIDKIDKQIETTTEEWEGCIEEMDKLKQELA